MHRGGIRINGHYRRDQQGGGACRNDRVVLSTYLEDIFDKAKLHSIAEIRDAVLQANVTRICANLMTNCTTVFGLMPVFWATGRGADVMKPVALPSLGGMAVSVVTMFIVPCLFCAVEEWKWKRAQRLAPSPSRPQP